MTRVFDIHNHILWGVDDGSESLDMSIRMLHIAAKAGTTDIILTPHNKPNRRNVYTAEIDVMIDRLREVCRQEGLRINLYPGNEIYYRMDVSERLKIGKATVMAGSRYVLLEYNPMDEWDYIKKGVDDMISEGYIPIIAHVERYANVMKDMNRAYELISKGCYLQINAGSCMGDFGFATKGYAKKLLKENMVSFVASDAHEDRKRTPDMASCIKYITKKYGDDYAKKIWETNPMKILADEYI